MLPATILPAATSAFATIACPAELALCSSASTVPGSQSRCLYEHTDRPHPVMQTPAGLRAIGPSIRKVYLAHRVRDGPVTMRGGEAKSGPALLASVMVTAMVARQTEERVIRFVCDSCKNMVQNAQGSELFIHQVGCYIFVTCHH